MDFSQEVINRISDSTKAFEEFKARYDARFAELEANEAKSNRPRFAGSLPGAYTPEATEHKEAFSKYIKYGEMHGLRDLEGKAMASSTNSGADGGYAVPKVIDGLIQDQLINISPIRSIATVAQTSTQDYHKLVNMRGTASGWVGEVNARSATNSPQFADVKPTMGDLYANLQATQQMLDDVFFNADQWIADQVATEFARAEGQAFVSGNGLSAPTGFLSGPLATTADGARAFGTLQYIPTGVAGGWPASNPTDFLVSAIYTIKAGHRQNACWVMPKSIVGELMTWKDSSGRYILSPMQAPGMPANLLGFPIVECEDMPAKATNSLSIAFGNFRNGYLIVDRIGMRVIRDSFTNKPFVGFYCVKRVGGAVMDSEAIKVIKFSTT